MKTTYFTIACLVMLTQSKLLPSEERGRNLRSRDNGSSGRETGRARDGDGNDHFGGAKDTGDFVNWASHLGKTFGTTKEFTKRLNIWKKSDQTIKDNNAHCDETGESDCMRMGHNKFSDMTDEERQEHLGLANKGVEGRNLRSRGGESTNGIGGNTTNGGVGDHAAIDWFESGHTGVVKNQGSCGSCYAFSANTTLEAAIAIETGNPYQRLSEQQIVDCGNYDVTQYYYNYGCQGGYMSEVWWFQMDRGAMLDAEYPYVSGATMTEGNCVEDSSKYVAGVETWGSVANDIGAIKDELTKHPLAIAVSAGQDAFYLYESGVIKASECNG